MQTITSARVSELFTQLRPVLGERDWRLVGAAVARFGSYQEFLDYLAATGAVPPPVTQ